MFYKAVGCRWDRPWGPWIQALGNYDNISRQTIAQQERTKQKLNINVLKYIFQFSYIYLKDSSTAFIGQHRALWAQTSFPMHKTLIKHFLNN